MNEQELERIADIVAARLTQEPRSERVRMLDARAAGQQLGVPPTWLLAQARARKVPHRRFGKYVRFDPSDVAAIAASTLCAPRQGR